MSNSRFPEIRSPTDSPIQSLISSSLTPEVDLGEPTYPPTIYLPTYSKRAATDERVWIFNSHVWIVNMLLLDFGRHIEVAPTCLLATSLK